MIQKVINVGNSSAITIPKSFLKETKMKSGDQVIVEADFVSKVLTVRPKYVKKSISISEDFTVWTEKLINKYQPVLEELAQK